MCRYLSELLAERQNLGPFMQVLPNCSRLLNQGNSYFWSSCSSGLIGGEVDVSLLRVCKLLLNKQLLIVIYVHEIVLEQFIKSLCN